MPWSSTQIMIKLLQGISCLVSCNSRYHLTNHGFSCFQKIIVLEEGIIITLCFLQVAQMLQRTTSGGRGFVLMLFVCFKAICLPMLDRQWYVLSLYDTEHTCVISAFLQGLA